MLRVKKRRKLAGLVVAYNSLQLRNLSRGLEITIESYDTKNAGKWQKGANGLEHVSRLVTNAIKVLQACISKSEKQAYF